MKNIGIEYPAKGEMRFYELGEAPKPSVTEILIRTLYSGITNGTERHALMAEHGWQHFPGRHGYQHVGVVEAKGDKVTGFAEGDIVYTGRYVGHRGWHIADVAYADRKVNHSHLTIVIPPDIEEEFCALLGVAGVATRNVRRCQVRPPQKVWVAGAGPIGQFAAQAARALGAHVTITDLNEMRLQAAKAAGAHRTINVSEENGNAQLQQAGPYNCIIDACGLPSLFLDIQKAGLLAHGGVIGAVAVRTETVFHWSMFHGLEASMQVTCHYSLDDLEVLLHLIRQGVVNVKPLVTHRIPIEDATRIYGMLRDKPGELLGVIFRW